MRLTRSDTGSNSTESYTGDKRGRPEVIRDLSDSNTGQHLTRSHAGSIPIDLQPF